MLLRRFISQFMQNSDFFPRPVLCPGSLRIESRCQYIFIEERAKYLAKRDLKILGINLY